MRIFSLLNTLCTSYTILICFFSLWNKNYVLCFCHKWCYTASPPSTARVYRSLIFKNWMSLIYPWLKAFQNNYSAQMGTYYTMLHHCCHTNHRILSSHEYSLLEILDQGCEMCIPPDICWTAASMSSCHSYSWWGKMGSGPHTVICCTRPKLLNTYKMYWCFFKASPEMV